MRHAGATSRTRPTSTNRKRAHGTHHIPGHTLHTTPPRIGATPEGRAESPLQHAICAWQHTRDAQISVRRNHHVNPSTPSALLHTLLSPSPQPTLDRSHHCRPSSMLPRSPTQTSTATPECKPHSMEHRAQRDSKIMYQRDRSAHACSAKGKHWFYVWFNGRVDPPRHPAPMVEQRWATPQQEIIACVPYVAHNGMPQTQRSTSSPCAGHRLMATSSWHHGARAMVCIMVCRP